MTTDYLKNGFAPQQINERNLSGLLVDSDYLIPLRTDNITLEANYLNKFKLKVSGNPFWSFAIFLMFCITVITVIWILRFKRQG